MARMTAAQAAVEILKKEGVTHVFGLPGAAINPFYKAMETNGGLQAHPGPTRRGRLTHGRGVHPGPAGNIGVCVGTVDRPART